MSESKQERTPEEVLRAAVKRVRGWLGIHTHSWTPWLSNRNPQSGPPRDYRFCRECDAYGYRIMETPDNG